MDSWGSKALSDLTGGKRPPAHFNGLLEYFCFPYQLDFIADQSRFLAWESSRQIGKSFSLGWRCIFKGAAQPKRHQTILAASERQALEVLDKVNAHCNVLQKVSKTQIVQDSSKHQITLLNGSKIRALPANPRTARGFSGDLYLDEFAHVQNDRILWEAVLPIISRADFSVTVTSTPLGDEGVFYDITHQAADAKHRWSVHRTTVHDAMAQGLKFDLDFIRSSMDEDSFRQEYECEYLSFLSSMFPWALLRGAMRNEDPTLGQLLAGQSLPTYLGVDIGRRKDLTSIVRGREFPEGAMHLLPSENLVNLPFEGQRARIRQIIREERVGRCRIDATGIGAQLAEELQAEFPGVVEPVTFYDVNNKNRIVTQAKIGLERGALTMPADDPVMLADFHKIKRHVTPSGNIIFDAARDKTGHADRFWAAGLCLDAAITDRGWDFGVIEVNSRGGTEDEKDHAWFASMEAAGGGLLDRAPRADELGFLVVDDDDLEDLRESVVGSARRDAAAEPDPEFRGDMPHGCVLPVVALGLLVSRLEDPCWGCDVDRRVCSGRPPRKGWKSPEPVHKGTATIIRGDSLRDMLAEQGEVPPACYLDGAISWRIVSDGADPCMQCAGDRSVCGGRPVAARADVGALWRPAVAGRSGSGGRVR